jgi:CHAT domain-containing protein
VGQLRRTANQPGREELKDCPSVLELGDLFTLAGERKDEVLQHVSGCARCAAVMRSLIEPSEHMVAEDETLIEHSGIMTRAWAGATARNILGRQPTRRLPLVGWMAVAASVLLMIGGVFWLRNRGNSPEKLLAVAYASRRPFEYRLGDGGYGPVKQTRAGGHSAFDKPEALLRAESELKRMLAERPEDVDNLKLRGRAEMLDENVAAAIESLARAQELRPNDASVLSELGVAYALRAAASSSALDYGHSIELLKRSLRLRPGQAPVLFNLALVYEKAGLVDQAIPAWNDYLSAAAPDTWTKEAHQHLDDLKRLKGAHAHVGVDLLVSPSMFVQSVRTGSEAFIEPAWAAWLPQLAKDPATREAWRILGRQLLIEHGDAMFGDVANEATASLEQPVTKLGNAIQADNIGQVDEGLRLAREAEAECKNCPAPVRWRAELEELYALQRQGQFRPCIQRGRTLQAELEGTPYPWMLGRTELEFGACLQLAGDGIAALGKTLEGTSRLTQHGFALQALRGRGLAIEATLFERNDVAAWQLALEGMRAYWMSDAPAVREHEFYYNLSESSQALGWMETAAVMEGGAVDASQRMSSKLIEPLQRAHFARVLAQLGDRARSKQELEEADRIFATLPDVETVRAFKMEALVQRARLEAEDGDSSDSLHLLSEVERNFPASAEEFRADFLAAKGMALSSAHRWPEARAELTKAIALHERMLALMPTVRQRQSRASLLDAPSRQLGAIDIEQGGHWEEGFRDWERFRQSPVVQGPPPPLANFTGSRHDGCALLVYAKLGSTLDGWLMDASGLKAHALRPPPEQIRRSVSRIVRLASSPDSDVSELRKEGSVLAEALIDPFEPQLSAAPCWLVSRDDAVDGMPFSLLVNKKGEFMGLSRSIAYVTSLAEYQSRAAAVLSRRKAKVAVFSVPGGLELSGVQFPVLAASRAEAVDVREHFQSARLYEETLANPAALIKALEQSDIVHYSGHGWSAGENGALVFGSEGKRAVLLTADSIVGVRRSHCYLAVLSACISAIGENSPGTNPDSLVHALLSAGVHSVVASEWNVDSAATQSFMHAFYEHFARGDSVADSLRRAVQTTAANSSTSHPYFWAAFADYGAP